MSPRPTLWNHTWNRLALALVPLLLAAVFPGCSESPEAAKAKKEAGEAVDALGDLLGKTKEDLVAGFNDSLSAYEDDIQRLKEDAKAKGAQLSEETKQLIGSLEEKAASAKESLSKLNENKGEVFDSLVSGTKSSFAELKKAIAAAREAAAK